MTLYDFIDDDTGEAHELDMPMGTACAPGEEMLVGGRMLRRLMAFPSTHMARYDNDQMVPGQGGIKVWSQTPYRGQGPDPRGFKHHDPTDGVPIVRSRAEIKEVESKTADTLDPLHWTR